MKKHLFSVAVATSVLMAGTSVAQADLLDDVMERGYVQCGVTEGLPGFSNPDDNNEWTGLEVDYCRALAAAIFDDPDAVRYTPLTTAVRFESLSNGNVDVLSRTTTWTMSRDTDLGLSFAGVTYYDGQGFIVRSADGVTSALELDGAAVCIQSGTTTELNATDYFAANGMDASNFLTFASRPETVQAYIEGRCDTYTTDASGIAGDRTKFDVPSDHIILPEIISKEPLGPAVRSGDTRWFNITRWVLNAWLGAEELGVTSVNIDSMLSARTPAIRRLLGVEGDFGQTFGLAPTWMRDVIRAVGSYGELYERHFGSGNTTPLRRGQNALWTHGGLIFAPPIN